MTHRLTTNYAKNYCNRTLIVKVIVENVVTCFFGTQCIMTGYPAVKSISTIGLRLAVLTPSPECNGQTDGTATSIWCVAFMNE